MMETVRDRQERTVNQKSSVIQERRCIRLVRSDTYCWTRCCVLRPSFSDLVLEAIKPGTKVHIKSICHETCSV